MTLIVAPRVCPGVRRGPPDAPGPRPALPIPPSGSLNTTVTVDVNATGPGLKENATDYRCYFLLANAPRTTAEQALAQKSGITLTPKPGTTPVVLVTGKIPK